MTHITYGDQEYISFKSSWQNSSILHFIVVEYYSHASNHVMFSRTKSAQRDYSLTLSLFSLFIYLFNQRRPQSYSNFNYVVPIHPRENFLKAAPQTFGLFFPPLLSHRLPSIFGGMLHASRLVFLNGNIVTKHWLVQSLQKFLFFFIKVLSQKLLLVALRWCGEKKKKKFSLAKVDSWSLKIPF